MVIEAGDRALDEGEEALDRIVGNLAKMDDQANTVMLELDRQINKLDKVYDDLNDTETTLKRYRYC